MHEKPDSRGSRGARLGPQEAPKAHCAASRLWASEFVFQLMLQIGNY